MPSDRHYRTLAKQYTLLAERATTPMLAEGYRKLAEGYATLASAHEASLVSEPPVANPAETATGRPGRRMKHSA
jgi:hypothetical protein